MDFCSTFFFIILFILLFLSILWIICSNTPQKREPFTQKREPSKKPLKEAWPTRFKELLMVSPILYKDYFKPMSIKQYNNITTKPNLIFVSIASYRDNQCPTTIKNLSEAADNPENLRFVVCQQNSLLEKDCLRWCKGQKHPACEPGVSRIERLSYHSARGPTWARWRIQQEWNGEEYFLQIDAHTRMIPSWDTILKEQLEQCPSSKPILTQYPLEYDIVQKKEDQGIKEKEHWQDDKQRSGLYIQKFDDPDGFTRIQSDYTTTVRRQPFRSTCWAAGFSFSKGEFVKEVPYDPYTPFLFFGEEMDIAIRAFTHGWDFFSPSRAVVFHNYKRDHRRTFWENPKQKPLEILSRFRIYVRLGYLKKEAIPKEYSFIMVKERDWPLGQERTIEEWEKMAKVNIKEEKVLQ